MYLLYPCSQIPLTTARTKPKNATATFQKEKDTLIQNTLHATMVQSASCVLAHYSKSLTSWGNIWASLSAKQQTILCTRPTVDSNIYRSQWCCSSMWIRTIGSSTVAQSSAYTQQRGLGGFEFWKDAWLQPHSKERSALHTVSVATRGTDMEKYKGWHVIGHCSSLQLLYVALNVIVKFLE